MARAPGRSLRRIAHVAALSTVIAVVAVGADVALARPGGRAPAKAGNGLPDLDRRFAGVRVAPTAAQLAAVRALGDVEVGWTELGTPHSLRRRTGTLTGPSTAAPDAVARGFLRANAALFRQRPADVDRLRLTMNDADRSGATFLRYVQTHGPRTVHGSSMLVVLDQQRRVLLAGGTLAPSLGPVAPPVLTADEAVATVAANVNPRRKVVPPRRHAVRLDAVSSTTFHNDLALPALPGPRPVEAELVTVPAAAGGRTAWRVRAEVASNADYETLVDATTGEVLYRKNQWSASEPHGLVHTGDDPEAGGQVPDVLFSGTNGTWVDGQTTAGNNTNTFQDLFNDGTPDAADQPSNADQHFDYAFSDEWGTNAVLPTAGADRDAVVTQLFYYTNWFHDYAYGLGFTETARNFQDDNFGNGGSGGDALSAQSDDSYGDGDDELCTNSAGDPIRCRNNANFNAMGPDGTVPRMQMYVGEQDLGGGVFRRTQRSMNRDTVVHEYTHGISGRIISDGNLAGGVQSGALGEGWSDALATSINDDSVYGEYNNGNYTTGIRGVDYANSTRTYGDLCDIDADGCQVHADGTIWATAMWEVRAALVAKHGFAAGKALHENLVMLGMKSTVDTPSFHDARTGYLAADSLLDLVNAPNSGNQCLIWRVFADNELGVTNAPDSDDDSTPTVSTETPDECSPEAVAGGVLNVAEGTDAQLDGTASVVGGDAGDTLAYEWDLDNDGQYDDSTSPTPLFTDVGNDGVFTVGLRVTNTAGYADTAQAAVVVTNVAPSFAGLGADGPKPEGSVVTLTGTLTDPGWEDDLSVTVDWNDGSGVQNVTGTEENARPDATLAVAVGHAYGDNGLYAVEVCRSDDDTSACQVVPVQVTNVVPAVTIDAGQLTSVVEGQPLPVLAQFSDPGWLDTYTGLVDPGSPALPAGPGLLTVTSEGPPADTGTVEATVTYGDNGSFDVTVSVTDDDGGTGSDTATVTVLNVDPAAEIDETGSVLVNGVPTFFADTGVPLTFTGRVRDPGSDDETTSWGWDDGSGTVPVKSRVNVAFDDPLPSPHVVPRDYLTSDSHAWTDACMYDVGFAALDDDGGAGGDTVKVLITGAPALSRNAGYWQHQYKGNGSIAFTTAQLDCYLEIAGFLSNVFNEVRDASTRQKAHDDIFVAGLRGNAIEQLDRQLLTGWVNFANGGVEYTELLDTNGDLVPDTTFVDVMATAESVRLNPASTKAQVEVQRDILQRVNSRDGL